MLPTSSRSLRTLLRRGGPTFGRGSNGVVFRTGRHWQPGGGGRGTATAVAAPTPTAAEGTATAVPTARGAHHGSALDWARDDAALDWGMGLPTDESSTGSSKSLSPFAIVHTVEDEETLDKVSKADSTNRNSLGVERDAGVASATAAPSTSTAPKRTRCPSEPSNARSSITS